MISPSALIKSTSGLVETSSERVEIEAPTGGAKILEPFIFIPRSFTNYDSPPFNQPVLKTSKRSNTLRISSYLYRPSDATDIEMAEDQAPYSRLFPQAEEEATDTGIIDQVFWGAARALHLPGREDAGNHGISRHLILPTGSPMLPASFSRCII